MTKFESFPGGGKMMFTETYKKFNRLLVAIADSIDIPESCFKEAEDRYLAVGRWLGQEGSSLALYGPEMYPQGSFCLGTVIKQKTDHDEYDIDLVCQLDLTKKDVTQKQLKQMVGNRLKENKTYKRMLDEKEGPRCWTLHYADGAQFHMNIIPSVPDDINYRYILAKSGVPEKLTQYAICVTDKNSWNYDLYDRDWPHSNPVGYAQWFRERMKVRLDIQRKLLAERMNVDIEQVPEYRIKTPLQRSIQLLKRHRDIMFSENPDDKPSSIIITTLAALAYDNQADLYETLVSILNGMANYIKRIDNTIWIPNPVNPGENLADKWNKNPQKELKFKNWLLKVQFDLYAAFQGGEILKFAESLIHPFGGLSVQKALSAFGIDELKMNSGNRKGPPEIMIRSPSEPW
jgi:hypothetical protein